MAGTDFVVGGSSYSYDDMPAGKTDPALARFSVDHDVGYIFPMVREALALNPRMSVMANPWSPPAWMKADDRFVSVGPDGTLLRQYYGVYAQYLVRSLTAFAAAGIPVRYLGVQNEPYTPLLLVSGIPNSFLSGADEGRLIADYVAPALRAAQLGAGILAYDDAFQRSESFVPAAMTVAGSDIRGLAYHCYLSDESSMRLEHDLYPQQPAFETECASNLSNIAPAQMTIRSLRNWADGVQLWNAALDQRGGPKIGNGCQRLPGTGPNAGQPCIAPVIVNTHTHTYSFTSDYWALAQFSRFIRLGAVRIGSSDPSNCIDSPAYPPPCGVEDVAMRNPDGSEVLVATSNDGRAHRLVISEGGQSFAFTLPDGGTVTFVWPAPANPAAPLSGARCQSHRAVVFHLPRGARHVVLTLDGHRTTASPRGRALRLTLAGRPRSAVKVLITARVGARTYTRLTTLHPCQPRQRGRAVTG